jgi:mannose-6-phosphate isomerase-like protein (cupin superfamily)
MTTLSNASPISLDRSHMVLLPSDLSLVTLTVGSSFWETAHEQAELEEGRLLSVFDYQNHWTWWERHPLGDELAYVVRGEIELLLDDGDHQWSIDLEEGNAGVVPTGTWHSARIPKPSTILFVTPTPARTEHRDTQ